MKINKDVISYDIETAYTVSATWGLYDQNVAKVIREPFVMSISWKYLGDSKVYVKAINDFPLYKTDKYNDKELIKFVHELFSSVKVCIAHNGNSFDYKWITGRFIVHGLLPVAPLQTIDTLLIARAKFRFNSHKLKDLGKYFNLGDKIDTGGIDLWYKCLELHDKKAWDLMKKYNKQDVVLLEKIYLHMLPFITNHPSIALLSGGLGCKNCGHNHFQKRGFGITLKTKYQRLQCQKCGSWSKGDTIPLDK